MLKKILATTMACAVMAPVLSALPSVQAAEEEERFLIGSWWQRPLTDVVLSDRVFDDMAEAGINYFINTPNFDGYQTCTYEYNKKISDLCTERDMVFSAAIQEVKNGTAHSDEALQMLVDQNKDLPGCISYYLYDEPNDTMVPIIAEEYNKLLSMDPEKHPMVNLLPSYGVLPSMGTDVSINGSYYDYVSSWVDAVGAENLEYLSFDHYPFRASGNSDTYYKDLEVIRRVAYENGGLKTACFLQTGSWNGMRNPTASEQRWNMYSVLAYGIKNPNYFCWMAAPYVEPPAGEGMLDHVIDEEGNHTERYEPAKQINSEVTVLGPTLMKVDAVHVYHTSTTPKEVPEYPQNYFIQPVSRELEDDAIVSIMKCKDGSGYYIMIVNKNVEDTRTLSFTLDADAVGITGVKEVSKETGKPVDCDYADGVLTAEFAPGDGRLFKLEGRVDIPEPLLAPEASKKAGLYNDAVEVELTASDPEAEIYYTLDGSYPDATKTKYEGPITIGSSQKDGQYTLRAAAVRDGEISQVAEYQYVISNGPKNVALGKDVTFSSSAEGDYGRPISVINDGKYGNMDYVYITDRGPGWAQVDFGQEYTVNRANVCVYENWTPKDVIIQFSNDPEFKTGVTTVFNNDADNTFGQGEGTDEVYEDTPTGRDFTFEPVTARYMRCWNGGNLYGSAMAAWEEIQAYTVGNSDQGENLPADGMENWEVSGGGSWTVENGKIQQTEDGTVSGSNWNRSLTYTGKTYEDFILEGTFQFNITDTKAMGFIGFGIRKDAVEDTQDTKGSGLYVAVEPKGRVLMLLPGGDGEVSVSTETLIPGFDITKPFTMKVAALDDLISISINGSPIMTVKQENLPVNEGYISVHAGLVPITVSDLKVTPTIPVELELEQAISSVTPVADFSVETGTGMDAVLAELPAKVTVTDTAGKTHQVAVTWSCASYDGNTAGTYNFVGNLGSLPDGLLNIYGLQAVARVQVSDSTAEPSESQPSDGGTEGETTTTTQTVPATGEGQNWLWAILTATAALIGVMVLCRRRQVQG